MSKSLRLLIVLTTWVGGYVLLVNVVTDGPFLFVCASWLDSPLPDWEILLQT